jgi:hypothetical protein
MRYGPLHALRVMSVARLGLTCRWWGSSRSAAVATVFLEPAKGGVGQDVDQGQQGQRHRCYQASACVYVCMWKWRCHTALPSTQYVHDSDRTHAPGGKATCRVVSS